MVSGARLDRVHTVRSNCSADKVTGVAAVEPARTLPPLNTDHADPDTAAPDPQLAPQPDYRALFDAAPTATLVLTTRFTIVSANAAFLRLTGRALADLHGRCVFEAFPDNPDDPLADGVARLRESLERVRDSGRPDSMMVQRYDVAVRPAAGGEGAPVHPEFRARYWQPLNTPLLDADGRVAQIIHTVEEVASSQRVRTHRLRHVLAAVTDTIRDLKSADDIGYHAAAILGQALAASRVGYGTIEHGDDVLTVRRDWCAAGVDTLAGTVALRDYGTFFDDLKDDKFLVIDDVADDPRTRRSLDAMRARGVGALVNAPLVEHGVFTALLYVNNATPRAWMAEEVALIREVAARIRTASERLRGEAALRESEAKFRTIADALPQMVWSTLPDGYHDYYNEQWYAFTGVARGSTDGEGWNDIFHPDDQKRSRVAWQASLATGKTYEIQYRLRHHSGVYRWVLGRALPVRDEVGGIIRWMGTCTDIHDQKLAEDELRQAARRKDEFLAMLAHELRNPLAPISSAAQLLTLGHGDMARVKKSGEIILRQVRHLTDLVDDLLDVSRVTRGLVQIEKTDLDLKDVLHSAVEQARPLIEARQHTLHVEITDAPTEVSGDKTRLVQVVVNLLNNAAKYTAQGGQITLSLEADEREACIMVADNGSGISPNLLPYVFDLFVQAERTPDRAQGGLGLGLALVKRIAALHDGSVHALSEGLGQGSSFMMIIPLRAHGDAAEAQAAPAAGTAKAPAGPARVLIVDDHIDGLQMLSALLTAQGHQVAMAQDGAGALKAAASAAFDVYVLDIGLPDIDGYQLARQLRMTESGEKALMIALTGYGQAHDRVLSKAAGFDHHFVKPVDSAVLAELLMNR
ncbi:MAG: hybrid sensor histidine kinase/response regulator [Massilia sp.]|nr:hybrid sensor histidine kinase/response regulator [Massilia sp.]